MTMHADQLVGAPVIDSDGRGVGTVEQVFRDDVDGTPSWARIRSHKGLHFVPLAGGKVTHEGGLRVAFDEQKILSEPDVNVDRHMSVDQEEELRRYFGLSVPAQAGAPEAGTGTGGAPGGPAGGPGKMPGAGPAGGPGQAQAAQAQAAQAQPAQTQPAPGQATAGQAPAGQAAAGQAAAGQAGAAGQARPGQPGAGAAPTVAQPTPGPQAPGGADRPAQQWMIRSEERFSVNLETQEASRVRLRKYVETEPVEQTVKVYHEEYEIERVPIAKDDRVKADLAEGEQEIILHEARAIITKESIPVERIRLAAKRVEEDRTIRDELRRERIEILGDDGKPVQPPADSAAGQPPSGQSRR